MKIKLSEWARQNGLKYQTVWRMIKNGKFSHNYIQLETGTILVDISEEVKKKNSVFLYARVSSSNKKGDLESQLKLCEQFCISKGWSVDKSFKEIASGMNDNRQILNKIIEKPPSKLVVLYKDRLTRFGFNYLEKLLSEKGCELVVINRDTEEEGDLVKDFVSVITSFCCRLYGARRGQAKALKMKEEID